MNKTIKKIISVLLSFAFLLNIALPLREASAMTGPWWGGSQATGSSSVVPAPAGEGGTNEGNNNQSVAEPVLVHNGDFIYQHIKAQAFTSFILSREDNGLQVFLAKPEKAVVDFLYLHLKEFSRDFMEKLRQSYRFQNLDTLKQGLIIEFSRIFANVKLTKICVLLSTLIKDERER